MTFLNILIRFKAKNKEQPVIKCTSIYKDEVINKKYILILREKLKAQSTNYTKLNEKILMRAELSTYYFNDNHAHWDSK